MAWKQTQTQNKGEKTWKPEQTTKSVIFATKTLMAEDTKKPTQNQAWISAATNVRKTSLVLNGLIRMMIL